ncbi:MAG: SDR family NAD(P)-dependent oxidoreductase [Gammaproteobacteria bacterium]|nr:SDR family NAD(P)-dependent oxidoreductase [Gammaproteobacteria bacterium]
MPFISRRRFLGASAGLALTPYLPAFAAYAEGVPRSTFGAKSTAEEVTAGIDLTGKTALVTGCNSGIGYETMRVLALRGAHVIGTARTMEKGRDACASVEGRCTPLVLELTDFDSVVACANQVQAMDVPLDILVPNAGILFREHRQVGDLEMHFVVNHLGHFLLVHRLLDQVIAAPQGRVVVVGSRSHHNAPADGIRFDDLSGRSWDFSAYGHSKLANGLFSLELARRFEGTDATSNSLHPGSVATNIFRTATRSSNPGRVLKDLAEGAATTCYVATSPALANVSGYYFVDCNPEEPSSAMQDVEMAKKLWDVSEELVSEYLA